MNSRMDEAAMTGLRAGAQFRAEELARVVAAGTNLEVLIKKLCPNGVPYLRLDSLVRRHKGTAITAGRMREIQDETGELVIYAGGQTQVRAALNSVPSAGIIDVECVVVKSRGNIGFAYAIPPFTHKNELWSYSLRSENLNLRFLYYYLISNQDHFRRLAAATSVKMPQLSVADTDRFKIPVPPVEVQEEIVRILDLFTTLEAELEAELEARRSQYAHYRDALLSFNDLTEIDRERAVK